MAYGAGPAMLYLRAFGGLSLENGGRPLSGVVGQRGHLAMLAMLAMLAVRARAGGRISRSARRRSSSTPK